MRLVLATLFLCAPFAASAGQGMSIDDGFAVASTASSSATAISPMTDGGSSDVHAPGSGRGVDEADAQPSDSAPARGARAPRAAAAGDTPAGTSHAHKTHGKTPWQSLLPGQMK